MTDTYRPTDNPLRPPTRICSGCSTDLAPSNPTNHCLECRLIERNRRAALVERGKQLTKHEDPDDNWPPTPTELGPDADPDAVRLDVRDAWDQYPDADPPF